MQLPSVCGDLVSNNGLCAWLSAVLAAHTPSAPVSSLQPVDPLLLHINPTEERKGRDAEMVRRVLAVLCDVQRTVPRQIPRVMEDLSSCASVVLAAARMFIPFLHCSLFECVFFLYWNDECYHPCSWERPSHEWRLAASLAGVVRINFVHLTSLSSVDLFVCLLVFVAF